MRVHHLPFLIALPALLLACHRPATTDPEPAFSSDPADNLVPASQSAAATATSFVPLLTQAELDAKAGQFVAAIESRNIDRLRGFYPEGYSGDTFAPDAIDPTFARTTLFTVVDGNAMAAQEISNDGSRIVSILFYRRSVAARINDMAYLQEMFDKTLFVCNFDISADRWVVAQPILCYDETTGPFDAAPSEAPADN